MADSKPRELEQELEVIPAIRMEDAEWKLIQQNTFTRWVNNHLKKTGDSISNLETEFSDGLKLINLATALSQKNVGRHNKKVNFRSQKLENVSLALKFFQDVEGIKIINIDSSHIVDQNKKLILGLIWTLILHYSISMGWVTEKREGQPEETPKQKLLSWIRSKLPNGLPVTNFTSDWNDGLALGALVDSIAPGSVSNWKQWTPDNALANTQRAMQAAQDLLGVAPLITANELIHPEIDEMSVMTYLSQFPAVKLLPKKEVVPEANLSHVDEKPTVGVSSEFNIVMPTDGFKPKISIKDPEGNNVHHTINKENPNLFTAKYTPTKIGPHQIKLTLTDLLTGSDKPLESAKKTVNVLPAARLCPYSDRVRIGEPVALRIEDAFAGPVEIIIVDGDKSEIRMAVVEGTTPGVFQTEYIPKTTGLHSMNVFHNKAHIAHSPFPLRVTADKGVLAVWGRGLSDSGIRAGDRVPIYVESSDPDSPVSSAPVQISVVNLADGSSVPVQQSATSSNRLTFEYEPQSVGEYEVRTTGWDEPIGQSPYKVSVLPATTSKVRAFGPGLEGGISDQQGIFTVTTNGETNSLAFSIEGPSKTEIICEDRGQGTALVAYTPKEPGIYKVNVLAGGEHIQSSPFVVKVDPADSAFHPSAVQCTGLDPSESHSLGEPVVFHVNSTLSGATETPVVRVLDKKQRPVAVAVKQLSPGQFECEFIPKESGKHHVDVSLKSVAIPGSPFPVKVSDAVDVSKLRIFGPGVDGPVISQEPTHFTIDAKQAGPGAVEVSLADRQGRAVDIDVLDNKDGSFTVKYTAPRPGAYQLNVVFAGAEIPPIKINVKPHVDLSGIRVEGLENDTVLIGHRVTPVIDTGSQKSVGSGLELIYENDEGQEYLIPLDKIGLNTFTGNYLATSVGTVKLQVLFDDLLVKECELNVVKGQDASKCVAMGEGLGSDLIVGEPTSFNIKTNGAGDGGLSVEMTGPAECISTLKDNADGSCLVSYVPPVPGEYDIAIMYGDERQHIPGSPFHTNVDFPHDPSRVAIAGLSERSHRVGEPVQFSIDASRTKSAPITARVPPIYQQPMLTRDPEERGIYHARFTPVGEVGDIVPIEVCYDGKPVFGSPFMLTLLPESEPSKVTFCGPSGKSCNDVFASKDAFVVVDASKCGKVKSVSAQILGPDGKQRACKVDPGAHEDLYEVRWKTDMAGQYTGKVTINGVLIEEPIKINAMATGKPADVQLRDPLNSSQLAIGEKSVLTYDRRADDPNAKLSVVADRPDAVDCVIESRLSDNGSTREVVHIRPTAAGPNKLNILYGGQKIDEIEYTAVTAAELRETVPEDPVEVFEKNYDFESVSQQPEKPFSPKEFKLDIDSSVCDLSTLQAIVKMPTRKFDTAEIVDNHDGTVQIKYVPKISGAHELSILQEGSQVTGTPIKFFVDTYQDGFATVYGPGLQNAQLDEPAAFTVCAKGSAAKELSVSIEGPAQSTIKIHDNKDGTCSVTWVPPMPGEYHVHVKLGGKEVHNSPFTVLVAGEGQKRAHLSVGSTSEVALNITQNEIKGISASIKSPAGIEEPCFVRMIEGGRLGVSFTPREAGEHLITVKRDGKLLPKAPFKIKVDKSQVGDAGKVDVSGAGKTKAICLQDNEIIVDTSKAGYGGLSVSVQGPSKAELTCKEVKAGLIKVNYKPSEPGVYVIAIKFADHHVRDSPLTVNCTGKGLGRVQAQISKKAAQAGLSIPGQEVTLYMKLPNCNPMDINARIMDPKGATEDVEMRDLGDQFYQIKFKPKMEGAHALSVLHKEAHLNGSPFQFTVGSFTEGGAHKVRASGAGVLTGETQHPNCFNLYHREAGAGTLGVTIDGPSKAALEFKDHKDGNCHVEYKVSEPGEYIVAVKFEDVHIPDSPFKVFIAPHTGEARKLELANFHGSGAPAGKAFTFSCLTHRARGHLEAKVVNPNNSVDTIDIVPIEDGESYAMRFIPKETGNHYIHVTLDGAPMRDSPFRLRVGGKDACDPTAISVQGDGLKKAQTGQKGEFIVSTTNAGAGVLTVQIDGPSKVTLDAYEIERGYKVRYTALAPGTYYATVKYNGIHVPASPFKIPIEGKELGGNGYNESAMVKVDAVAKTSRGNVAKVPEYHGDANKVVAKGAGLNKFFPGRPTMFTIDTGLAGANLLMVGIITTKGPCEEVMLKHQGSGQYAVNYKIPDRVKGFIFIKYGDQEIPGSPFAIEP